MFELFLVSRMPDDEQSPKNPVILRNILKKSFDFWDITPRTPMKINRRFGGIFRLILQARKINQEKESA
jgi:hypothetical protein